MVLEFLLKKFLLRDDTKNVRLSRKEVPLIELWQPNGLAAEDELFAASL